MPDLTLSMIRLRSSSAITRDVGPTLGANISAIDQLTMSSVGGLAGLATPWYSDQILPFDITLAASNEYGAMAGAKILGVEILNEGTGISINDTVTETQATFVARENGNERTTSPFPFPLIAHFSIRSRRYGRKVNEPRACSAFYRLAVLAMPLSGSPDMRGSFPLSARGYIM
jgi:hypothetical protein